MRDKVIGNQGSTTVEAALLYPIILLVIISLLIAGTVWYQKTYFKSVVYDCVQSVALSVTKSPDITVFTTDLFLPGKIERDDPVQNQREHS